MILPDDDLIAELDAHLALPPAVANPKIVLVSPPPVVEPIPLPEADHAFPPSMDVPVQAPEARQPLVLIVEDNADYRKAVRYLLIANKYEAAEARDGVHGLKLARELRPDLILMDFNMPQMNGYELVQELRQDHETREIPLIMFTGSAHGRNLRGALPDLCAFLEKPVTNERLLQAVRQALAASPVAAAHALASSPAHAPASSPAQAPAAPSKPDAPADEAVVEIVKIADAPPDDEFDDSELLVNASEESKEEVGGLDVLANDSPLISRVNKILVRAVKLGASDIHIEPQERELVIRMRVNGTLQRIYSMPLSLAVRVAARLKIMATLVITERRLPQDGQIRAIIKGKKIEFRVSCLPSLYGEKIVMRVLGGSKIQGSLAESGFQPRDLDCIEHALKTPHGLILVTGPTGSGKTTTLYTMIRAVNTPDVNIMTVEDPVEYELSGITQVQVRPKIGLTFESVLRSFLRQDPDIMLVGEIRDMETAEIAVKAAVTGHLVFSTLHTNSAPATIMRLAHMGLAPFLLAASVKLVIAQRLVRRLCLACRIPSALADVDRKLLTETEAAPLTNIYRSGGCSECLQTGYKGRMPLFEVMTVRTAEMRQLILASHGVDQLAELAVKEGMIPLRLSALSAVASGQTSLTEALKVMVD